MKCLSCDGELELADSQLYARCTQCKSLFMNVAGTWQLYAVDENMKSLIEQSLGFAASPIVTGDSIVPPKNCLICGATFEVVRRDHEVFTRCPRCGALARVLAAGGLQTIIVDAPGGGWNPEFQAIFEEKLGFAKKIRRKPIGIPE